MTESPMSLMKQMHVRSTLIVTALLIAAGVSFAVLRSTAEVARTIPLPAVDEQAGEGTPIAATEVAVLAGGCFWGVQGVFQHVDGVTNAVSGYAGGEQKTAHYEMVGSDRTGHAESVRITFDPRKISYGRILQIYFSVAHDPTQLNRQGPDVGTQYRSAIFPANPEQARIAKAYIGQLNQARVFNAAIVGLSSGFPHAASGPSVYRLQRPAEDRGFETSLPRSLSRGSGAGCRRAIVELSDRISTPAGLTRGSISYAGIWSIARARTTSENGEIRHDNVRKRRA